MTHLSPEYAQYIEQAIQSGSYDNERDALDEAVALLKKRDQLRAEVQVGIDQADRGELLPADKVFERLRKRAEEIEAATFKQS